MGSSCQAAAPPPPPATPSTGVNFPYRVGSEDEDKLSGCQAGYVAVDNTSSPDFTVLTFTVNDYPGLLRVMSWVLNGMSVRVHHGLLGTKDGVVTDTLYLTDFKNRKLKDSSAQSLAERLQDFVVYCAPQTRAEEQREWHCGMFDVSNAAHDRFTLVTIRGEPASNKPGFLLELASALTSIGASIQHGVIQGSHDAPQPAVAVAEPGYDFKAGGRYFQFLLSDSKTGGKLDVDRISSLVFTLGLLGGKGHMPTVAPNMEAILNRF